MKMKQSYILPAVGAVLLLLPLISGPYVQSIGKTVLMYLMLSISWNLLIGSGQLSFGIAGFFGLGSYAATLAALNWNLPGLLSIPFAFLFVGISAYVIGLVALRLRGMYFAISTLALAEIFKVVIHNWHDFTGGPNGKLLPKLIFNGDAAGAYILMAVLTLLVLGFNIWFKKSKYHYALTSIRNNEIVAMSSGIDIYKSLLIVFSVTAAIQGMVGAAYANQYGFVTPESSFNVNYTLLPLAMTLLGGLYTVWGPVIGAVLLGVLGEFLKLYIPYGHLIVYGIIIVLVILFMPKGIVGTLQSIRRGKPAGDEERVSA
jgi:branched-chain amino acid transport system permease protein